MYYDFITFHKTSKKIQKSEKNVMNNGNLTVLCLNIIQIVNLV